MLCILRRSLLLAISRRIRRSWSRCVSAVRGMLAKLQEGRGAKVIGAADIAREGSVQLRTCPVTGYHYFLFYTSYLQARSKPTFDLFINLKGTPTYKPGIHIDLWVFIHTHTHTHKVFSSKDLQVPILL
ncbi:hypothetical protein FKM82_025938 [Ascaphus truei]